MRLHGRGVCSLRRAFSLSLPTFHTSVRTLIIVRPSHFVASKAEAIGTGLASWKHPLPLHTQASALDPQAKGSWVFPG